MHSPLAAAASYQPAETLEYRGALLPARFGALDDEYRRAHSGAVVFDRSDRGLLIVTGRDRQPWLHNLVTNAVTTLPPFGGCYAFAPDVKGRIQFDLNILNMPEALWLDIDSAALPAARAHLERFLITEDAAIRDATDEYARLGCSGPTAGDVAVRVLEMPKGLDELASLQAVALHDQRGYLVRNDFAGLPAFELIVPRDDAAQWWQRLTDGGATAAGFLVLDALRIEARIPWLGREIDERTLPAETGQAERAINYHKGCYLGQEVVERMRSRGSLAKRLVALRMPDATGLTAPQTLQKAGAEVGRLTSLARHPMEPAWIGLGYLKTSVTEVSGITTGDPPRAVEILP